MSNSTSKNILERIGAATKDSPIAVFKTNDDGIYNAVFAATVKTTKLIDDGDKDLIGVFFGELGKEAFADNIGI